MKKIINHIKEVINYIKKVIPEYKLILKNYHDKKIKPFIKSVLHKKITIKIIAFLFFLYSLLVGYSTTWKITKHKRLKHLIEGNFILVGWHSRTIMLPFFWKRFINKKLFALVSPHHDGQIMSNFLKCYDINVISGSTNEQANKSALTIMKILEKNNSIFISPDGPRGPRMRMKKSPIYFASKTGIPIVCACFSSSAAHLIKKSWDHIMIPLPFGKGIFNLSEPFYVPKDLTEEQIEEYRQKLENIANSISFDCDKQIGREPILPAAKDEIKIKRF